MNRVLVAMGAALVLGCTRPDDHAAADFAAAMRRGIAALEADDPVTAITEFRAAARFVPSACEPHLALTLAHFVEFWHQERAFNDGIFGGFGADPDALHVAAVEGGLVENLLVRPLLEPAERILTNLTAAAAALGRRSCGIEVDLPLKAAFGSFIAVNFRVGRIWSEREAHILSFAATALLAVDRLLLSHNIEIPPLTAIKVSNNIDRATPVGLLRSLGVVPAEAPNFLLWNEKADRRALFDTIPDVISRGFAEFALLAEIAQGYLNALPAWTSHEVFWVYDLDDSGSVTPGDRLVLNVRGKIKIGNDVPLDVRPLEFTIGAGVRPQVLTTAVEFLQYGSRLFAGEVTPGARLKLEQMNGIFTIFGQERPFEDVLEVDPLAFFRGPLRANWLREDENANCSTPRGTELECPCQSSHTVPHPETGLPVTVRVVEDVLLHTEDGPRAACLRERAIPENGSYPDPPAPQPLRAFLPYWYTDPLLDEGRPVFGVEGEKSVNILNSRGLEPFVILGDWDHFIFGDVRTDDGIKDLYLPGDCIAPPVEDTLGLITTPYLALRDPTFGSSVWVNLAVLTGGECADSTDPNYRSWQPADRYAMNKVIAHYYNRYGRLIYDVFAFLVQ